MTVRAAATLVLIAIAPWGCQDKAGSGTSGSVEAVVHLSPEEARSAIVALVREKPDTFIGRPDLDRLATLPVTDTGDGKYAFGAFSIDLPARRYQATIGMDSPEPYFYGGSFVQSGGKWKCSEPNLTRAHVARTPQASRPSDPQPRPIGSK